MSVSLSALRNRLAVLTNSSGIHKEQADKYRQLLDQILLNGEELVETLKLFIEASKFPCVTISTWAMLRTFSHFPHFLQF